MMCNRKYYVKRAAFEKVGNKKKMTRKRGLKILN